MLGDTKDQTQRPEDTSPSVAKVDDVFVETAGYRTHLLRSGEGKQEMVILLHGAGPGVNAWFNWRFALPFFGRYYECLAPDLVGFGRTDHPDPPPRGMRRWTRLRAEQILSLLEALGVEKKAHLVGQSRGGGALALRLLAKAPERFGRVVLMGAGGTSAKRAEVTGDPPSPSGERREVVAFYENPSRDAMARIIAEFVYDEHALDGSLEEMAEQRFEEAMRPEARRSFGAMYSLPPPSAAVSEDVLRRITNPALLVHGRDDKMVPVEGSYYLLRHLPNAQLHVYPKCGHWAQIERRDSFHRLVLNFISGDV